jgi:putative monooxygenase
VTRQTGIVRLGQILPVDRGGGVRTYHLVTQALGAQAFVSGITEFDPGASLPLHYHNCDESVTVLQGCALFEVEGVEHRLGSSDTTLVPADAPHRFSNLGPLRLRILWVYGSAAPTRTLASTGECFAIGSVEEQAALRNREGSASRPALEAGPTTPPLLKGFHHVGVVVEDIGRAAKFIQAAFGVIPEPGVSRADLVTLFFSFGDARLELIEPLDRETRQRRLAEGRAKIEHIAFEVDDLGKVLRELAVFGVRPTAAPRKSAGSLTFWTDPETSQGISFQFLQRVPD